MYFEDLYWLISKLFGFYFSFLLLCRAIQCLPGDRTGQAGECDHNPKREHRRQRWTGYSV